MEYRPFEPFKALNPGEKVLYKFEGPICTVVALHEIYFFGKNESGYEWDISYEVWNSEEEKRMFFTSRFLWTIPDHLVVNTWTSADWDAWVDEDHDYIYCK